MGLFVLFASFKIFTVDHNSHMRNAFNFEYDSP